MAELIADAASINPGTMFTFPSSHKQVGRIMLLLLHEAHISAVSLQLSLVKRPFFVSLGC